MTAITNSPPSGSASPFNMDTKPLARSNSTTAPPKPTTKAKPRKRVNTAEKRSQHNAIERARRETLNSKFLILAGLLPALSSHRRPSKSAIVNNSISHLSFQRNQRLLAARIMRDLRADRDSILEELNAWRSRAGHPTRHAELAWSDEAEEMCRNVDEETFGTFTNFGADGDEGEGEDEEEDNDMQVDLTASNVTSARGSTSNPTWDSQHPHGSFDQSQLAAAAAAVAATNTTQAQNVSWSHEFAFKLANPTNTETPQTSNLALTAAIQTVSNAMNIPQPPVHLPFSAFIPDHPSSSPSGSPTSISNSGGTTMLTPPRTADGLVGLTYGQIQSAVQQKTGARPSSQGQFFVNPAGLIQTPSPGSSSGGEDQYNLQSSVSSLSNSISIPHANSNTMSTPMAIPPPPSGGQWSAQELLMLQQMQMRTQPQLNGMAQQSQTGYPSQGSFDASSFSSSSVDSYSQGQGHVLSLDPSQFQHHMQRHKQQQQQTHQSAERIARSLMAHMNNQNPSHQSVSYFQQQQQQQQQLQHQHQQQQQQLSQHSNGSASSLPLPSPFLPGTGLNIASTPGGLGGMTTPGGVVPEEQVQQWRQAALASYLAQAQGQGNSNSRAGQGQGVMGMQMGWQGGDVDVGSGNGNGPMLGLNGLGVENVTVEGF